MGNAYVGVFDTRGERCCVARFEIRRHRTIVLDVYLIRPLSRRVPYFILSDRLEDAAIALAHTFLRNLPWRLIERTPEFDECVSGGRPKRDVIYIPNLIGVQPAGT